MLSVATLKSASQASNYYESMDYYTKDSNQNNSCWFGVGAKNLNLEGAVDPKVFKQLLKGELPNGTIMHKGYNAKGKETRRPGYDLTFSAPKSVSILSFRDPRIIEAHNTAVKSTLEQIEQQAAARVKIKGEATNKLSKNLIVGTFLHNVSRLLDPDLHTHCVIVNATQINGKYRSVYGDDFYNLAKPLGLEYRLSLAQNLMQLGYELEQTSKEGFFEIKGVPKTVIKQLSKRRQEIEQVLEEQGLEKQQKVKMVLHKGTKYERTITTVASSMANFITREQKVVADLQELEKSWDEQVIGAGFSVSGLKNLVDESHTREPVKIPSQEALIVKAIPLALKGLSERKAIFSKKELLFAVKAFCITSLPNNSFVEKIIAKHINNQELIPLEGDRFTTASAIQLEKNNILVMQQQQDSCGSLLPIGSKVASTLLLKESEQRAALQMLLESRDRFIAIDSIQEVEQQKVLKAFNLVTFNTKSYVVAPKHEQAKKIKEEIGANGEFSLNGFLHYVDRLVTEKSVQKLNTASHVWLIWRSHTLSSKNVESLEQAAIQLNARIVFLGDRMRQLAGNAGAPFRYLLDHGIEQAQLTGNSSHLNLLREQKITEALLQMQQEGSLIEVADGKNRLHQAVDFAVNNNSTLITQNNIEKQTANNKVRDLMQEKGMLSGSPVAIKVLVPMALSTTQKQSLANYQLGDLIRFNKGIQNTIFSQGAYFTIVNIDQINNKLTLQKENDIYSLDFNNKLANKVALYRSEARELRVGDKLVWQDSTPKELQVNREFSQSWAKVTSVKQNQRVELVLPDNKSFVLDLTQHNNRHIEYAYAQNLNAATYKDFNNAVILLNNNLHNISFTELYSTLAAITGQGKLFCGNIEILKQSISGHSGLKEHAHLQAQTVLEKDIQANDFAQAKGELEGALLRHNIMLEKIAPATEVLGNQEVNFPKTPEYLQAVEAVNFAITKLSERKAIFTTKELTYTAKKYDIKVGSHVVEAAIKQAKTEGLIISKENDALVTKEIYAMESACLKIQKQGERVLEPIITGSHTVLDSIRNHAFLTEPQKQAIVLAATSSDRVNLIQGISGSGKTTMLKEVKNLATAAGFQLLGVANTASAKNNLKNKTANSFKEPGIPSRTLTSFLNETSKMLIISPELAINIYNKNTMFILDEASLVSVRDMFRFLDLVEQLDARALIVGDYRQLPSIEASRAFKLLLGTSNSKVVMNVNTRLHTKEALQLMQDVYAVRIDDAFDKLRDNLIEIPNRAQRLQAMANYYLSASKELRSEIMPMLPLNKDRVDFNNLVRAGLKKEGTLSGMEINCKVLVAKDLTKAETNYHLSFEIGDLVKFNHAIKRLAINKGDLLVVTGHNDNQVLLVDQNGNKVSWDPVKFAANFKSGVEIYNQSDRNIMVGDIIRWTRNDEERGIINSETAEVFKVDLNVVTVKLNDGQLLSLDLDQKINQHWDHAYGSTVHVVQGLDKYNPIGQGLGAPCYQCDIATVNKGDQLVIPGDPLKKVTSKVGQVVDILEVNGKTELIAIDRLGNQHRVSGQKIEVYPDFSQAKAPSISSLESFLVMATRGDKLVMFVDNIQGYKAALTANQNVKQTALEIMLPSLGIEIQDKVNAMTNKIYGLANLEELNHSINNKENTPINNNIANKQKQQNANPKEVSTETILKFTKPNKQLTKPSFDLNQIKQELNNKILEHVSAWKGKPNQITTREARWGKKGSFSVIISGSKKGTWADFEAGVAGTDLVSLYMHTHNLAKSSFVKALEQLTDKTGIETRAIIKNDLRFKKEPKLPQSKEQYMNKVEKLYSSSKPILGTSGEKYFANRGIQTKLPNNFRFKARCWHDELKTYRAAVIIPGHDPNGKLQSVNRIYLNKDGNKIDEKFKDQGGFLQQAVAKKNYGSTSHATIKINEVPGSNVTLVAEGIENALSVKQAWNDANIIASFGVGQLKNLTIESGTKTIILCADNDGLSNNTKAPMLDALQKWKEQGYQVKIAMPFDIDLSKKFDFNDLLNTQGERAVRNSLSQAIAIGDLLKLKDNSSSLSQGFIKMKDQALSSVKQGIELNVTTSTKEQDRGIAL